MVETGAFKSFVLETKDDNATISRLHKIRTVWPSGLTAAPHFTHEKCGLLGYSRVLKPKRLCHGKKTNLPRFSPLLQNLDLHNWLFGGQQATTVLIV